MSDASKTPPELQGVGMKDSRGTVIDIDHAEFRDEAGKAVALGEYFKSGKPVILSLVYYTCPNLCNLLLEGVVDSLKKLTWRPGNQFEVVLLSINPREDSKIASTKRAMYLKMYGHPETDSGWHFLTGDQAQIDHLAKRIGFGYKWDPKTKEYAHASGIYVVSPQGKIAQILYGVQFEPKDLRLALMEASDGKVGGVLDQVLFYCCRYDPMTHTYSLYIWRIMSIAAGLTVLLLGGYLGIFWFRQHKNRQVAQQEQLTAGG